MNNRKGATLLDIAENDVRRAGKRFQVIFGGRFVRRQFVRNLIELVEMSLVPAHIHIGSESLLSSYAFLSSFITTSMFDGSFLFDLMIFLFFCMVIRIMQTVYAKGLPTTGEKAKCCNNPLRTIYYMNRREAWRSLK